MTSAPKPDKRELKKFLEVVRRAVSSQALRTATDPIMSRSLEPSLTALRAPLHHHGYAEAPDDAPPTQRLVRASVLAQSAPSPAPTRTAVPAVQ
jgi:hypothetical protein